MDIVILVLAIIVAWYLVNNTKAAKQKKAVRDKQMATMAAHAKCAYCSHDGMIPINPDWAATKVLLKILSFGLLVLFMPGWTFRCPECNYKQGILA